MHRQPIALSLVLLCVMLFSACAALRGETPRQQLRTHRQLWDEQKITEYRYTFKVGCLCPPEVVAPVIAHVRDGQPVSLTYRESSDAVNSTFLANYDTMDKLFGVIESAINSRAYMIRVTYDPELGYPAKISIDYEKRAVDDEISWTISDVEVLQKGP